MIFSTITHETAVASLAILDQAAAAASEVSAELFADLGREQSWAAMTMAYASALTLLKSEMPASCKLAALMTVVGFSELTRRMLEERIEG